DPGAVAEFDALAGLGDAQGERLLREDALEVPMLDRFTDDGRLRVRRDGNVEHFHLRVGEQVGDRRVDGRNRVAFRGRAGIGRGATGDGDRVEPRLPGRDQVTVARDERGADTAD